MYIIIKSDFQVPEDFMLYTVSKFRRPETVAEVLGDHMEEKNEPLGWWSCDRENWENLGREAVAWMSKKPGQSSLKNIT